ncbi:MAG: hypothetical protein JWQ94_3736 [Tardiphaga sp.]|nr:hypothetical protein [Tardiphaga sp.]
MAEMVERLAKVLAHIERVDVDDEHRMMARAAIEAMRDPTPEMFSAVNMNGFTGDEENFRSDWSLAIGTALK